MTLFLPPEYKGRKKKKKVLGPVEPRMAAEIDTNVD